MGPSKQNASLSIFIGAMKEGNWSSLIVALMRRRGREGGEGERETFLGSRSLEQGN